MFSNLSLEWLQLADAVAKATLILSAAACVSVVLRRRSAAARHLVWTLALCSAVAMPALSLALPRWQLPIVRLAADQSGAAVSVAHDPSIAPAVRRDRSIETKARNSLYAAIAELPAVAPPSQSAVGLVAHVTWQQALFAIWLAGTLTILARVMIGIAAVRWLSRRTQEVVQAPWLPMAQALAAEVGVGAAVRFLRSGHASMPVAAGIFRPSIIMPVDADSWSESRLRVVMLHELAHVKRRDCLTHVIAQIACAFYWFNPLAWMAAKRARTERERACDDLVLASGTRGSEYADQLLDIARCMRGQRFAQLMSGASLAMAHQSQLEGRLIAILDPKLPRAGVSRAGTLAAVALCCCAVAPLGALHPWAPDVGQTAPPTTDVGPGRLEAVGTDDGRGTTLVATGTVGAGSAGAPAVATPPPPPAAQTPDLHAEAPGAAIPPVPMAADLAEAFAKVTVEGTAGDVADAGADAVGAAPQEPKPDATPRPASGAKADPRMVAALTAALKDTDKGVRETAMHALIQLRDPAIFEPLVQALKDASADVREQAVFGLGQMRDKRAVTPLTDALKDTDADVREQAAFALGQLRDRASAPALIPALKDTAANVRQQAAFALGQLRDPAAVDALGAALQDASPEVREQAVFALSQIRDKRSVQPLISALKDASAQVREQAAFALGQLRDRVAVDALIGAVKDTNASVREQVVFALGQLRDPRVIDALTTALKDPSASVREQAAFALGQLAR